MEIMKCLEFEINVWLIISNVSSSQFSFIINEVILYSDNGALPKNLYLDSVNSIRKSSELLELEKVFNEHELHLILEGNFFYQW